MYQWDKMIKREIALSDFLAADMANHMITLSDFLERYRIYPIAFHLSTSLVILFSLALRICFSPSASSLSHAFWMSLLITTALLSHGLNVVFPPTTIQFLRPLGMSFSPSASSCSCAVRMILSPTMISLLHALRISSLPAAISLFLTLSIGFPPAAASFSYSVRISLIPTTRLL